jgi:hypothetical protein
VLLNLPFCLSLFLLNIAYSPPAITLPLSWAYDLIDEFLYQFQTFLHLHILPEGGGGDEDEKFERESTRWDIHSPHLRKEKFSFFFSFLFFYFFLFYFILFCFLIFYFILFYFYYLFFIFFSFILFYFILWLRPKSVTFYQNPSRYEPHLLGRDDFFHDFNG